MNTHHACTQAALTRIATITLGICTLVVLSGCTIQPLDGSTHRNNLTPITFTGLTPEPDQRVVLEIFNQRTGNWQPMKTSRSADRPISAMGIVDRSFGSEWYPVSLQGTFPHLWQTEPDGRHSLRFRLYLVDDNGKRLEMPSFKSLPALQPGETLYDYLVANGSENGYGTIYTENFASCPDPNSTSCWTTDDDDDDE
ncbi:MAG: hypothetical protein GY924_08275 [Planctomycetaceae bacterium]|nr:hypothetical protein [Planctomycetaceae bacterium]